MPNDGFRGFPPTAAAVTVSYVGLLVGNGSAVSAGRTLTGTTNKIDVSNGTGVSGNPTITISATYVGQTSITTLGTIATGVWNGTDIAIADGGTGASTAAAARVNLGFLRAALTSNFTDNTATLANLTDLSVTLTAGKTYTGKLALFCSTTLNTDGIKVDFDGGSATATSFQATAFMSGVAQAAGSPNSTALATDLAFTALTGSRVLIAEIAIVVNAGGTFIPRAAENTSGGGLLTVVAGSYLWLDETP